VKRLGIILFCMLLLVSCDSGTHYAPVTDINPIESIPATGNYRVNPGETLYEIAWRYGLDYRYVAMRNAISPPYAIRPGQVLYLDSRSLTTNKKHNKNTFCIYANHDCLKFTRTQLLYSQMDLASPRNSG